MTPLTKHFIPAVNKGMTSGDKLMIVLHGRGDTLHSYKVFSQELNVTGLNYLLLNAPFVESFGYTWYDDSFSTEDLRYQKSMELLEGLLEEQAIKWGLKNIFLFGFSQGGRMVLDLFVKKNAHLGGVVALSPRITAHPLSIEMSTKAAETPLFVAHGEQDPIIPILETRNNLKIISDQVKSCQFTSYPMGHEIDISEIQALRAWMNERL
jgi:predicted esterase